LGAKINQNSQSFELLPRKTAELIGKGYTAGLYSASSHPITLWIEKAAAGKYLALKKIVFSYSASSDGVFRN